MEIHCSGCEQSISFRGDPPKFCQHCGRSFDSTIDTPPPTSIDVDATHLPMTSVTPNEPASCEGDIVGSYRLVRWLGSGGMGTVCEAIETKTGRRVALKRLSMSMVSDESYVKRFVREAQLAAQISHPNVTFIYGATTEEGQSCIAMELMPGKTLCDRVTDEGQLSVPDAVDSILDVVEGLIAAHRLGVIHRDVKPANCFVDTDETVKIGDFGLSKSLLANDVDLTQTGTFMGTPSYAAPEQIRAGKLDGRTDIYSVGATLYFLLTGRTPFKGDAMSVTAQIITDKPVSTRQFNPGVPKDLDNAIFKCLEKDPVNRFHDLEQLKIALLPYASKQESIADLGRRLAAFMIDQSMIQIVFNFAALIWVIGVTYQSKDVLGIEDFQQFWGASQERIILILHGKGALAWLGTVLYYALFEGRYGRGLGKKLMGLHVVNREGQRPGFGRALIRAIAVPGCFAIPLVLIVWYSRQGDLSSMSFASADYFIFLFYRAAAYVFPILICISTMRSSNRLRGIQGMISGTRVIRLGTNRDEMKVPVVQPNLTTIDSLHMGPYTTSHLIGTSSEARVFLGHDETLNRDVWIVEGESDTKPSEQRINLSRVSRQRWLDGGDLDHEKRWDAYEAIHGMPIQTFVGTGNQADWSLFGRIMTEIIEELQQAIKDNTLPDTLSLPQVWLDEDGHAKLVDELLVRLVVPDGPSVPALRQPNETLESNSVAKGVRLVKELGDLIIRTQVLPSSIQDFQAELHQRPETSSTLDWAHQELETLAKSIGRIRWDTRLGVLSATFGIELPVYSLIAGCLFLSCYYIAPIPNTLQFLVGIAASLVLPVTFGAWFRGGPVFRVMGIQVCSPTGRPASRLKCAIRSGISWLPVIALLGAIILTTMESDLNLGTLEPAVGSMSFDLRYNQYLVNSLRIAALLSGISLLIGLVVSIVSPKKGLADFLLGTELMPK